MKACKLHVVLYIYDTINQLFWLNIAQGHTDESFLLHPNYSVQKIKGFLTQKMFGIQLRSSDIFLNNVVVLK